MPPTPGRGGPPGRGRAASRGAVLRPDGAAGADRHRPRRCTGLPQRRLPRRHPRRARLHLRRLRRGDQDQLRHLPAATRCSTPARWASDGGQRQGADLQRQGRGPALPRPPQHPAGRRDPARRTRRLGLPAGPFADVLSTPRLGQATPPARRTSPAGPRSERVLLDAGASSAPTSCCPTCSPTPRTSASSTPWWCTRSPPGWPGSRSRRPTAASRSTARPPALVRRPGRPPGGAAQPTTRPAASGPGRRSALGTVNAFSRRLLAGSRTWPG